MNSIEVAGDVRVEYRVRFSPLAEPNTSLIESETRGVGGSGVLLARQLLQTGQPVRLQARIGDDSHGRFVQTELEKLPGLELQLEVELGYATPYAILLESDTGSLHTLLSTTANPSEDAQNAAR